MYVGMGVSAGSTSDKRDLLSSNVDSALGEGEVQGGCRHALAAGNDRVRRLDKLLDAREVVQDAEQRGGLLLREF